MGYFHFNLPNMTYQPTLCGISLIATATVSDVLLWFHLAVTDMSNCVVLVELAHKSYRLIRYIMDSWLDQRGR